MMLLAVVLTIFKVVFWLCLIAVAGLFLFALICETIESFRSHNRRAARIAAHVPPAPSISEGWIGTGLVRRLRHELHF
jgi:hypothetical protein